ncbi:hypothetical protein B0H16DRAFT_1463030 [Mycena metata]|uniref:Uncharacterized protein n=1 Tax=Mycena metata TaxID=1033252 RepID=A0AAD7ILG3_9AGAR|nr:hypothetical protein B0H16DRAFT_1463030 [Mycena metata]
MLAVTAALHVFSAVEAKQIFPSSLLLGGVDYSWRILKLLALELGFHSAIQGKPGTRREFIMIDDSERFAKRLYAAQRTRAGCRRPRVSPDTNTFLALDGVRCTGSRNSVNMFAPIACGFRSIESEKTNPEA